MSFYNVAIQMGGVHAAVFSEGWLGFPLACICAMCLDWFLVSRLAKGFAFRFLITPESSDTKKVLAISCSMVVCMVFCMSLYGAVEGCVHSGARGISSAELAHQHPPQLYYGPALPAARGRAAGAHAVPPPVSRGQRALIYSFHMARMKTIHFTYLSPFRTMSTVSFRTFGVLQFSFVYWLI